MRRCIGSKPTALLSSFHTRVGSCANLLTSRYGSYTNFARLSVLSVRLARQRISDDDVARLRQQQAVGEAALAASDVETYRAYNRELHASILRSANNSYLSAAMGQVALQSEMLTGKAIRIVGRPLRAIEEHSRLIEHIAHRDEQQAIELMQFHIMSALDDILHWNRQSHAMRPRLPLAAKATGFDQVVRRTE